MKNEKLEKIKELARRGVGGERTSAEKILIKKVLDDELVSPEEFYEEEEDDEEEDEDLDDDEEEYLDYEDSMTLPMMRKLYSMSLTDFNAMLSSLREGFIDTYIAEKFYMMKGNFGTFLFSLDQELFNDIVSYLQKH